MGIVKNVRKKKTTVLYRNLGLENICQSARDSGPVSLEIQNVSPEENHKDCSQGMFPLIVVCIKSRSLIVSVAKISLIGRQEKMVSKKVLVFLSVLPHL